MLHPAHLHPTSNVDTNKLAWLAWWQEQRSELVSRRNGDIFMIVFSGLIFAFAYMDGDVHWGHYMGGCVALIMAVYFYYRRRTENEVQEWDEIGQLPYVEQCQVVQRQLLDKGKPGWLHPWYLLGFPVLWVLIYVPNLEWTWTSDMTDKLIFGIITGVAVNVVVQYQKRAQWQKGVDLANNALAD